MDRLIREIRDKCQDDAGNSPRVVEPNGCCAAQRDLYLYAWEGSSWFSFLVGSPQASAYNCMGLCACKFADGNASGVEMTQWFAKCMAEWQQEFSFWNSPGLDGDSHDPSISVSCRR